MSRKKKSGKNLWSSRFDKEASSHLLELTESISFDRRLALYDIRGSLAHVAMLKKIGLLKSKEEEGIRKGLLAIRKEIESGKFVFDAKNEDVHMNIEAALIRKIGPLGGKVHTARSRNDQVAVDTKLYLKDETRHILSLLQDYLRVILDLAEKNSETVIPGYTHLQQAQPVSAGHYFLALASQTKRDIELMRIAYERTDTLPLGVGALAGVNYKTDRAFLAKQLGFSAITENSMDTVSDRDYQAFFLFAASQIQVHLSRVCEDFIVFNTSEFGFVEIDDAFTTGSSIMPNKKNPDIFELVRGRTGRILGNLQAHLVLMKGLPLTYNRDLQEDKPILFSTIDSLKLTLRVFTAMMPNIRFRSDNIAKALDKNFMLATDVADYLVTKGVPFREAHHITGRIIKHCLRNGKVFQDLTMDEWRQFDSRIEADIERILDYKRSVNKKISAGGTALRNVKSSLRKMREWLRKESGRE
jgi:argininosuccinate lyase